MNGNIECRGFKAGGISCGIKKNGKKDLGILFSDVPAAVAGIFTQNIVQAAPVVISRQRVASGSCRALIVNSGNANCCTGDQGMKDAQSMTQAVADSLNVENDQVLVASTGVIGQPMPMDRVRAGIPELIKALRPDGFDDLAHTIMTTDTIPKVVKRSEDVDGDTYHLIGLAKGAGMIRPDMATMLCFICTDVHIDPQVLKTMLQASADKSFNRITIDGDTSTNDTLLVMANGASGISIDTDVKRKHFAALLDDICLTLAKMLVKDGEGVTKLVEIVVKGADSDQNAMAVADTIAHSNLVKTAFFGEDANWGRIIAAAGRAGVPLDPDRIDIFFNDVQMVKDGTGCGNDAEASATRVLKKAEFTVTVDLKNGSGTASLITCDFSVDYVRINADYRS